MEKVRPNFLIVGAAKAGTTSLYHWLKQHPEIFMPDNKEPSYFIHGYGISILENYLRLFEPGRGKKSLGEASAGYLAAEESPQWISRLLNNVRIVIVLRNPTKRAFSLYNWMIREGYESARTFEEALRREEDRLHDRLFHKSCPQYSSDYLYFTTGLYLKQIQRYYEHCDPDRIKIVLFDDLVSDPTRICKGVFDFLGVDTSFSPLTKPANKGVVPRYPGLQYWLRNHAHDCWPFCAKGKRRRNRVIHALMGFNERRGDHPALSQETYQHLSQRYRDDLTQLGEFLNLDLSRLRL